MSAADDSFGPAVSILDADGFNELRRCRTGPLLYNKHDIYIGGSLRKYGEFSWGEQHLFQQILARGMLAVEVGANIGAHTVDLARLIGPEGQVHAFEPQRLMFQSLCANLALNHLTNVFAYQMALGDQAGNILVPAMDPSVVGNYGGVSLRNTNAGESVPLAMLDQLELPACHFMKVDVEGMEVEVVTGALATIEKYRPIMYLENDRQERSGELITLVAGLDYDMYWHTPLLFNPQNFANDPDDIFPNIASINVVCCPKERSINVDGMRRVEGPNATWKSE